MHEGMNKVAQVTLAFWIMKICATTLGETGGDLLSMTLNLGYAVSTAVFFGIFLATLVAQVTSRSYHPLMYWAVIISTTTAGTTLSDYLILPPVSAISAARWCWSRSGFHSGGVAADAWLAGGRPDRQSQGRDFLLGYDPVLQRARNGARRFSGRPDRRSGLGTKAARSSSSPCWR